MGIMLGCADRAAIPFEAPDQLGDECCFAAVLIANDLEDVWSGAPGLCQQNQTPFAACLFVDCSIMRRVETLYIGGRRLPNHEICYRLWKRSFGTMDGNELTDDGSSRQTGWMQPP